MNIDLKKIYILLKKGKDRDLAKKIFTHLHRYIDT